MAGDENKSFTEAQLQIERLRKLKEQKDEKEKSHKENTFSFAGTGGLENEPETSDGPEKPGTKTPAEAAPAKIRSKKQRLLRVERRNLEKISSIAKKIKSSSPGMRLSDDMLANLIIAAVLDLNLDFSSVKTAAELKELFRSVKV
jgi:hypothetical protein